MKNMNGKGYRKKGGIKSFAEAQFAILNHL